MQCLLHFPESIIVVQNFEKLIDWNKNKIVTIFFSKKRQIVGKFSELLFLFLSFVFEI
jgi:hypothetical protein